jgi:16S rRNA (guanine527-N7)-methyltransferase
VARPIPEDALSAAEAFGVKLDEGAQQQLVAYLEALLAENEVMNLTAITGWEEAWSRHLLDSLALLPVLEAFGARRVVDVGSGGGLPGIPLAIASPGLAITLVESREKKAAFLRRTAAALGLMAETRVRVLAERAEALGAPGSGDREAYDAVVARALAPLPVLLELTLPLLRVSGRLLAVKGARAPEEVASAAHALEVLSGVVVDQHRTATGTVLVIEKRAPTPRRYPRAPGTPKRSPL